MTIPNPVPNPAPPSSPAYAHPAPPVVVVQEPRKRVNHLLHLVLTLITAGLWLPVWIILALAKS